MTWNPDTYHRYGTERAAPFHDLLNLIHTRPDMRIVDLGCGTGELTRALHDHLPGSDVTGLDSSPEMLDRAQSHAGPRLRFQHGRIEDLHGTWDLIFSHAALQWVPGHHALLPAFWSNLAPGGQLAVQVPSNFDHPSHTLLTETAQETRFQDALSGWTRHAPTEPGARPVLTITEYGELLFDLGATDITALEKIYPVIMHDADGILGWVSGTALVPYRTRLSAVSADLWSEFEAAYRERLHAQWPTGPVFYAFKRTLFTARKPA